MNTTHTKIEKVLTARERRRKDIRDGKITAIVIIVALLGVMLLGTGCRSERSGCYMSRGFSGTH